MEKITQDIVDEILLALDKIEQKLIKKNSGAKNEKECATTSHG
jgi:hypothetical protein